MPLARSITLRSSSAVRALLELVAQAGDGVEARDAEIEDACEPLLLQAADHVGGDAGIDRGLDRGPVARIDEDGDRPLDRPAELEHARERGAARRREVDQDGVGVDGADAGDELRAVVETHHMAGRAQAILQDRRPDRIAGDDDDGARRRHGPAQASSPVPSRGRRKLAREINRMGAAARSAGRSAAPAWCNLGQARPAPMQPPLRRPA